MQKTRFQEVGIIDLGSQQYVQSFVGIFKNCEIRKARRPIWGLQPRRYFPELGITQTLKTRRRQKVSEWLLEVIQTSPVNADTILAYLPFLI